MKCWIKMCNKEKYAHELCETHYDWVWYWFGGGRQKSQRVATEKSLLRQARSEALKGLTPEQLIAEVENED